MSASVKLQFIFELESQWYSDLLYYGPKCPIIFEKSVYGCYFFVDICVEDGKMHRLSTCAIEFLHNLFFGHFWLNGGILGIR